MPIAEQLTEPLMDGFKDGVETTVDGVIYARYAGENESANRLFSDLYYTQWWQDPVQWDKFYDPRYLTFFGFRVKAREVYPHPDDSDKGGAIAVDVYLLSNSPFTNETVVLKKIPTAADYSWNYFFNDNSNYRVEWLVLAHNKSGSLRKKSDCYDRNNNPIRGTSYISVDEVQAEYRQWIIDDTFMTAELATLTPLPDYEPPIPYSQWREQDGEIKLGFGVEELPDFEEVLPLSLWRYDTTQEVCPYCTEMRGVPVVHHVFHRLLPGHLSPPTFGAFTNAESLRRVIIPETVKKIGGNSFQNAVLKRVRIATDCTYNTETTFPVGCKVNFYPDSNCAQLYDSSGKAVLDCNAARIFVKRSEENG